MKTQVYHDTYTSAINEALAHAQRKGFTHDPEDACAMIGLGNRKPSEGVTNSFSLSLYKDGKLQRKCLQIQVYGMGTTSNSTRYELNVYIN